MIYNLCDKIGEIKMYRNNFVQHTLYEVIRCCLKYEQDCYEELLKVTPKVGALVDTPNGKGYVEDVNLLTGILKVKPEKGDMPAASFEKSQVTIIKDAVIRLDKEEIKALRELEDK